MSSPFSKYKYKNQYIKLIAACYFYYVLQMGLKNCYSLQMVAIISDFATTKAQAAIGLTVNYFIYGIAQFVLALFIDKINQRKLLWVGTALTVVAYMLIGFSTELWQVWALLGVAGISQCPYWGAINYFMARYLPNDCIPAATKITHTGIYVATALVCGVSAFFIEFWSWKTTFVFMAALLLLAFILLNRQIRITRQCVRRRDEIEVSADENGKDHKDFVVPAGKKMNVGFIIGFCVLANFLTNSIYYGVGNWIPNMLKEVHNFPDSLSILLTLVLPLVSLPCSMIMFTYFDKKGNIFLSGTVLGAVVAITVVLITLGYNVSFWIAMALFLAFRFFHGCYNIVYTNYTVTKLKNYIDPGKAALLTNALAMVGAGFMPLITGVLLDGLGWTAFFASMAGLCIFAFIVSAVGYLVVRRNKELRKWF